MTGRNGSCPNDRSLQPAMKLPAVPGVAIPMLQGFRNPPRHARAGLVLSWRSLLPRALVLWALCVPTAVPAPMPKVSDPIDIEGWVSRLWEPVASYGGLLDPDDLEDVVVVLHRRDAIPGDEQLPVGSRGLAIFALTPDGQYRREALAEQLLPCVGCLGTFSRDPGGVPFEIDIEDRRLRLSWISNDGGLLAVRLTIAWDPARRAFALVQDEVMRAESGGLIRSRRSRDYVTGSEVIDGAARPMEPRFIPIDTVSARDYR